MDTVWLFLFDYALKVATNVIIYERNIIDKQLSAKTDSNNASH
jgi:hypothetical protein